MRRRLLLLVALGASVAAAQGPRPNMIERLQRMSPAERERFLDRIPPEKRLDLEKRLRQMDAIPPDVRQRLRREFDEFQSLPPERQEAVRRVLREINGLEPRRRAAVRGAVGFLRPLSAAAREEHFAGRAFQRRFSEDEQRLVREALEVLPPPPKREATPPSEEKLD